MAFIVCSAGACLRLRCHLRDQMASKSYINGKIEKRYEKFKFNKIHFQQYFFNNSYGWSYSNSHIVRPPLWPYISDTGDFAPESTLFTFIVNLAAVVVAATFYMYYKLVLIEFLIYVSFFK